MTWNCPVGVYEFESLYFGTRAIAHAVGDSPGFTLSGGGDTMAAIEKFHVADRIDCISTAGETFLENVTGKDLPPFGALSS